MNTFNKTFFRQKLFKCAVMIIILLQAACAANVGTIDSGLFDWTVPNPSKLASNGADTSSTCSLDMPGAVSARSKARSIAQGDPRLPARDRALAVSTQEAQNNYIYAQIARIRMAKNQDFQDTSSEDNASVRKGMLLGFLIGAGTGAIIGLAAGDDTPSNNSDCAFGAIPFQLTAEGKAVIGGILGGGAGLLVGGIVGAAN
jgi:hypothetical protein